MRGSSAASNRLASTTCTRIPTRGCCRPSMALRRSDAPRERRTTPTSLLCASVSATDGRVEDANPAAPMVTCRQSAGTAADHCPFAATGAIMRRSSAGAVGAEQKRVTSSTTFGSRSRELTLILPVSSALGYSVAVMGSLQSRSSSSIGSATRCVVSRYNRSPGRQAPLTTTSVPCCRSLAREASSSRAVAACFDARRTTSTSRALPFVGRTISTSGDRSEGFGF